MTGVFAVFMVFNPLGLDVTVWLDDIGEGVAAAIGAAGCAWAAISTTGRLRRAWYLLGAASASWAVGEGIWCWYQLARNVEVPFPSLADLFFLLAVPLMAGGVLSARRSSLEPSPGASEHCSTGRSSRARSCSSVGRPLSAWRWNSGGESSAARVVGLAYPVGDVITATVALTALTRVRGTYRRQLVLLAAGVISLAVADSMFAYLTQNGTYGNGNWLDTGWVAGFLLIGLAALAPRHEPTFESGPKGQSTTQLMVPYVPLAFAGVTAAVEEATRHSIGGILFAIGATTTALVMARQLQALLENRRLNRRLESTVTELEAREVDLARQAFHDPLTGLVNRVLFSDRLNHALERQRRDHGTLAVMLVDLDDFKSVNDTLGHLAGDEVLKQVASRLQASVRQADTIARIGGDEFALLLENVVATDDALRAVERVGHMLRTPLDVGGTELKASASVGIVLAPGPGPTGEELLRDADIALYEAKYSGKSCYRVFESSMLDGVVSRMQLKSELGSLGNHLGQLTLHYQPILSARTGRMTGVEALMRWQHPTRGLLYPTSFIEYAEETGAIVTVGAAAMDMACAQAAAWRDLGIACPDHLGEPVGQAVARSRRRGHGCALAREIRPPACRAHHRDNREHHHARGRPGGRAAPATEGSRCVDRHRRLRHRLVVALLSEAASCRLREIRPLVHGRRRDGSGCRPPHLAHEQPRPCPRTRDGRRRDRDRRATPGGTTARVRPRAGLPPRSPRPGRVGDRAHPRAPHAHSRATDGCRIRRTDPLRAEPLGVPGV